MDEPCTMQGSPVSGVDDCDQTSMCWAVDPVTLEGTCAAFCDPNAGVDSCDRDQSCVLANDGVLTICLLRCDPLVPDACTEGETCSVIDEDPVCLPGVGGEVDDDCASDSCAGAEVCVLQGAVQGCADPYCCTSFCDLNALDPDLACEAIPEHGCQPYYEGDAPPGYEHLGYCGVPG